MMSPVRQIPAPAQALQWSPTKHDKRSSKCRSGHRAVHNSSRSRRNVWWRGDQATAARVSVAVRPGVRRSATALLAPRRCQLDGQRNTVQPPTDVGNVPGVVLRPFGRACTARVRSMNSSLASSTAASAPARPFRRGCAASRLVARMRISTVPPDHLPMRAAFNTCSQLSTTRHLACAGSSWSACTLTGPGARGLQLPGRRPGGTRLDHQARS